ncbi:MAG: hypothetical protein AB7G23_15640 [Vicinamibacterales bacterium]
MAGSSPLLIEFAAPASLLREQDRPSALPILGNGPPGTFVLFRDGLRVSLPTDQIVGADDTRGTVRVSFGGMAFTGVRDGQLTFARVREVQPPERLSPDRSHEMRLDPDWVVGVYEGARRVWPEP